MINEPDIIKQLREEEKTGKLSYNDWDFNMNSNLVLKQFHKKKSMRS